MRIRIPKSPLKRVGLIVCLFIGVLLLLRWNTYRSSAAALQAIVDRLDAEDPDWPRSTRQIG